MCRLKFYALEHLLFAAYLILFAWLVTKTSFFTRSGLSNPQLVILFLLKVMTGIFYGWMGIYYGNTAQMMDTWSHHFNGLQEYQLLRTNPQEYLVNLFRDPYNHDGVQDFFASADSYWNDLKGNVFAKLLSVFDIFSFGNYYINVIFYSFITLFGPAAIYRVMIDVFPRRQVAVLIASFFIPSFLYWASGLHKEGALAVGIGLIVYQFYFGIKEKKWPFRRWLSILLGMLILLTLRNFILIVLLPALLAWLIASRQRPSLSLPVFGLFYAVCILAFFTLRLADSRLDFPQAVVNKQSAFSKIRGASSIPIQELKPTPLSFLENTPQAFALSSLRPYPSDVTHILSLATALEIALVWMLFVLFVFYRAPELSMNSFLWFVIFFSLTFLLAIGFSVNNLGAIARYRSIIFPLLLTPLIASIDWKKINQFISKKA